VILQAKGLIANSATASAILPNGAEPLRASARSAVPDAIAALR